MRGIKTPLQNFALKMQGRLMREGGVFAGHYGTYGRIEDPVCVCAYQRLQ